MRMVYITVHYVIHQLIDMMMVEVTKLLVTEGIVTHVVAHIHTDTQSVQ